VPDDAQPLRVLHLTSSVGEGGAQRQLSLLVRSSDPGRLRHGVVYYEAGSYLPEIESSGCWTRALERRHPWSPRFHFSLRRAIRCFRPDVVQTWLSFMDTVGPLAVRTVSRCPVVVSERNAVEKYRAMGLSPALLLRNLSRRFTATAAIANSLGGCRYLQHEVGLQQQVCVVHNALDIAAVDAAAPADLSNYRSEASDILLFVGRLHPQKNVSTLLKALPRLLAARRDCRLVICGDGSERRQLEANAEHIGVADRVFWLGFRKDVWSIMKAADVLVHPSFAEGYPNVVIEAAAAGVSLCISDIPPHRDLPDVEQIAGLFKPASEEDLANRLLETLGDPALASRRRQWGRRVAEQHSPDRMALSFEKFYRSLVIGRGPVSSDRPGVHGVNAGDAR